MSIAAEDDLIALVLRDHRLLAHLRRDVLEHARREEAEVLPLLVTHSDAQYRIAMGHCYGRAQRAAPNHRTEVPLTPRGAPSSVVPSWRCWTASVMARAGAEHAEGVLHGGDRADSGD